MRTTFLLVLLTFAITALPSITEGAERRIRGARDKDMTKNKRNLKKSGGGSKKSKAGKAAKTKKAEGEQEQLTITCPDSFCVGDPKASTVVETAEACFDFCISDGLEIAEFEPNNGNACECYDATDLDDCEFCPPNSDGDVTVHLAPFDCSTLPFCVD